jgi:hypothetical protein
MARLLARCSVTRGSDDEHVSEDLQHIESALAVNQEKIYMAYAILDNSSPFRGLL